MILMSMGRKRSRLVEDEKFYVGYHWGNYSFMPFNR